MKITSVLNSDSPYVSVRIEENGKEVLKTISVNDYRRSCFKLHSEEGHKVKRIGAIPSGFINGGVSENAYEAIIRIPAAKRPLFYFKQEFVVPFPDVVFYFHAVNRKADKTQVWFSDESGRLYYYPYGNVYADAKICWGGNVLPNIKSLKDFEYLVSLFFSAPTNEDLYVGVEAVIDGKKGLLTQRELIEYVSVKDKFPVEILTPCGMSIGDL